MERVEGNKIIAEFMKFSNWKSFLYGNGAYFKGHPPYHSSWDLQITPFGKVAKLIKGIIPELSEVEGNALKYFKYEAKYFTAVFNNAPEDGFKILVQMIVWYNSLTPQN